MAVVDASVLIAAVNENEPGHHESVNWIKQMRFARQPIDAPAILLAEVGAALSRGRGDSTLTKRILQILAGERLVRLHPILKTLAQQAAIVAAEQKIRGCDAVYVALAAQLQTELVTLDKQQLERGAAVIPTRRPGE